MHESDLAPIALSTYGRLEHLKKTIVALRANRLAAASKLFIFSDGPKPGDEQKVAAVRAFLKTIDGFRSVEIFERSRNGRIQNNRGGIAYLLERYDRIIFLEEDVVTAENFLAFMNQSLDRYAANPRVFSVTGYCPPIRIADRYPYPVFLFRRFNAWGFGIWKDRYEKIKYLTLAEFNRLYGNSTLRKAFTRGGGEDMLLMLRMDAMGKIDALDVKAMFAQFLSDQYTIYPTRSLVHNIGVDGSGFHRAKTDKFDVALGPSTTLSLPMHLEVDEQIRKEFVKFRRMTIRAKLGLTLRQLGRLLNSRGVNVESLGSGQHVTERIRE